MSISVDIQSVTVFNKMLLENIQFEFPLNRWSCILGASGVGKTTLLQTIANILPKNFVSKNVISMRENISYHPQSPCLLKWATVLDNVLITKRLLGKPLKIEKALHILKNLGLEGYLQYYPHELSGGMQQRVSLARTLFSDPTIILLDEPFKSLDHNTRKKTIAFYQKALKEKTVLMVTHNPSSAFDVSDQIFYLSNDPFQIKALVKSNYKNLIDQIEKEA